MSVKIFNDAEIYKIVRESVLSVKKPVLSVKNGKDFVKLADKFSGEEKFAVKSIMDLMTVECSRSKVNIDWMDFKIFFEEVEAGKFIVSESEKSAVDAVEKILSEIVDKRLMINILGDENKLDMIDTNDALEEIGKVAEDFNFGVTADNQLANKIFVVMIVEVI